MLLSVLRTLLKRPTTDDAATGSTSTEALLRRGLNFQSAGKLHEAEQVLRQATEQNPDSPDAWHLLGLLLHRLQRIPEALTTIRRAAGLAPADATIQLHLGVAYQDSSMLPEALACFEEATRLGPAQAGAFVNLGRVHRELGNLGKAEVASRKAVEIDPNLAGAWYNLGNCQSDFGHASGALASFERALSIDPDLLEARFARALTLLGTGDFTRGWDDYDARLQIPRLNQDLHGLGIPHLRSEPLENLTLLVWGEQGLGDEVMFASCFQNLIAESRQCVIACSPRLRNLFQRSFSATVVAADEAPAFLARRGIQVDFQLWSGSLSKRWRRELSAFPNHRGYLTADPERVEAWRQRLSHLGAGIKVGLSWKGGSPRTGGAVRSTTLQAVRPLLATPGCQFIDLQYGDAAEERATLGEQPACRLHRWQEAIDDLDECAALVSALDLVITVDSFTGHLAGALGRPVWIMVPHNAEWRYMKAGDRMPWYPSARLFRQQRSHDWTGVVERVARELTSLAAPSSCMTQEESSLPDLLQAAFGKYKSREYAEAEVVLARARRLAPTNRDVLMFLAMVLRSQDRRREALDVLLGATCDDTANVEFQVSIASIATEVGENDVAIGAYRKAIERDPQRGDLFVGLAATYEASGQANEAITAYRRAIDLAPGTAEAHLNLGRLLHERGELHAARGCFEACLKIDARSAKALFNLGSTLDALGDPRAAEKCLREATQFAPDFQEARSNLAALMSKRGDFAGALEQLQQCGGKQLPRAHFNLALSLCEQGQAAEAQQHFDRATEIGPEDYVTQSTIGVMFLIHGDAGRARTLLQRAAAGAPDVPLIQWNRALIELYDGPSARAWNLFDWRFHPSAGAAFARDHAPAEWRCEDLRGEALLVWGEGGVGDEILFASMYPDLLARGVRLVLECKGKLVQLFERSFPGARVVERCTPADPSIATGVAYQISAGGLGKHLRQNLASFPDRKGFLTADAGRVAYWRERLGRLGPGPKIGFSWRSGNLKGERALACSRLEDWGDLLRVPGVHWICLQYDRCEGDLEQARTRFNVKLHRFEDVDYFDDLDEVAALMTALDLVISAPTTVSMQAAALGVETWQMTYGVDWHTHGAGRHPWLPELVRVERRCGEPWSEIQRSIAQQLRARVDISNG